MFTQATRNRRLTFIGASTASISMASVQGHSRRDSHNAVDFKLSLCTTHGLAKIACTSVQQQIA